MQMTNTKGFRYNFPNINIIHFFGQKLKSLNKICIVAVYVSHTSFHLTRWNIMQIFIVFGIKRSCTSLLNMSCDKNDVEK